MIDKEELYLKLSNLKINFKIFNHPPLFTVDDSLKFRGNIQGGHAKNLFLKNKKNNFYLFSCSENTLIDLKSISKSLNLGNISFAKDEYLFEKLGLTRGSVSPFGLLNNIDHSIKFFFDKNLLKEKFINFHPMINTSTINLKISDFINFLIENKKIISIYDFENYKLIEEYNGKN